MAKDIADSVAKTSSEYIGDIMEMVPPKVIEEGTVSDKRQAQAMARMP